MSGRPGNGPGPYRYAAKRQQAILAALRATGQVNAADLAAEFGVTAETLRKDLIVLERQGLLRRVHGGALPVDDLTFEPDVAARTEYAEEKSRIARAALAHLERAGSVFLDAGSTTSRLAELLPADRELTVFTNTLTIALTVVAKPNVTVYTLGGRVRGPTLAEVDTWAARALREINVDIAFLGTNGISLTRGLTTPDPAEAAIKRLMLECARRTVLLADHSKVGMVSLCQHGALADVDVLITDTGLPGPDLAALRSAGLTVEQA
ncbi:DeoR/GlpR family DNA-binding transcription regulator [Pseudonocardia kunmingensis]|uniref:DeoR/GlpR family DNA-binding transcription regulator n=1 Tax=Pseudonocardia kunmingensis TaxID=630975 RepID=UPI001FE2BADE|nr:DeoR/GlpR family DNA-binding transcription regulator [Pseudonocardia kunmingensis]